MPNLHIFLDLPLSWNNIAIIKITNFMSLVNYLNKWKKTNNKGWFHFANIPLFCIWVNLKQINALNHSFCSLLFCLFLLFPTNVGNFKHVYDDMFINNDNLFPLFEHKLFPLSFVKYWKFPPIDHGVVFSNQFQTYLPIQGAHLFSTSPIFTQVMIISNFWIHNYSMGVNINLFSSSESTNLF